MYKINTKGHVGSALANMKDQNTRIIIEQYHNNRMFKHSALSYVSKIFKNKSQTDKANMKDNDKPFKFRN